jgi:ATP-dependent DNA helicase RecG
MYTLQTPLAVVIGVGPVLAQQFAEAGYHTVGELLTVLPLRYEDRSKRKTLSELEPGEMVTVQATVTSVSSFRKGPKLIITAAITDDTGKAKCMWFNASYLLKTLKKGEQFSFSGKVGEKKTLTQPVVERIAADSIHTDRIVPFYTTTLGIKIGTLRRLFKHILDRLEPIAEPLPAEHASSLVQLSQVFTTLHFPEDETLIEKARERLALEELLHLIQYSRQLKAEWKENKKSPSVTADSTVRPQIDFTLTNAQLRCIEEIMVDLGERFPMNRLLIGDVGAGKTLVAGTAMAHTVATGHSAILVCPTRILAEQHAQTLRQVFPDLPLTLLTSETKTAELESLDPAQPRAYVGTHAVLNHLLRVKPGLIVYDEQHRFGVRHRTLPTELSLSPHLLTLTATPIPRTLSLTIFSHLNLSTLDELPANRLPTKTWLVTKAKQKAAWEWLEKELGTDGQVLVICPFVHESDHEGFEHIASIESMLPVLQAALPPKLRTKLGVLHGQLPKPEQQKVIQQMRDHELQVLLTTPIVEVGVDLPAAQAIIILNPERFGLASLHQLRGRVGRAGQQGYCLLFVDRMNPNTRERLQLFTQERNGLKLAEYDLEHRGAGDIFGRAQHGLNTLRFGTWTDVQLIQRAQTLFGQITITQPLYTSPISFLFAHESTASETIGNN